MAYTDFTFFFFFLLVAGVYFVLPARGRRVWLLAAGLVFVALWNVYSALSLLGVILVSYLGGRLLSRTAQTDSSVSKHKKTLLAVFLCLLFGFLVILKYTELAADTSVKVLNRLGGNITFDFPSLLLPVGLSFYTFAAAGYLIDVYRASIPAETNLVSFSLFLAFFPNLTAGPIERSNNLLRQIQNIDKIHLWSYKRLASGTLTVLWGYFLKLVLADRAAILVNEVFDGFWNYGSTELFIGAVVFSLQIYGDFAGGSYMALGFAEILGFDLIDNFNAPYFSKSIKEFWRRWHISLSSWFRDYLYIPLGGNRRGEGRKYLNMAIVFLVCGLWHGANWTFLVWGAIHALYQLIGGLTRKKRMALYQKWKIDTASPVFRGLQTLCTFLLTTIAWILFRANSLQEAGLYLWRMLTQINLWEVMNGTIYELGLDVTEMNLLFIAVLVVFLVDYLRYKKEKNFVQLVKTQQFWVRAVIAAALVTVILFFGCYGSRFGESAFIYAEF